MGLVHPDSDVLCPRCATLMTGIEHEPGTGVVEYECPWCLMRLDLDMRPLPYPWQRDTAT